MNQDIESMFNGTVQETADARDAVSDVISENSKLNGDFESSGNIEIRGTVMGNVVIDGVYEQGQRERQYCRRQRC